MWCRFSCVALVSWVWQVFVCCVIGLHGLSFNSVVVLFVLDLLDFIACGFVV